MLKIFITSSALICSPIFASDKIIVANGTKHVVPLDSSGYPKLINNNDLAISLFMPGPGVGELKPLESHESRQFGWSSWSPIQVGNPLSELGHWCIAGSIKKSGDYRVKVSHLFDQPMSHQVVLSAPCKFELRMFPISNFPQVWDWGPDNESTWIPWRITLESIASPAQCIVYDQWIRLGHAEKHAYSIFIGLANRKKSN